MNDVPHITKLLNDAENEQQVQNYLNSLINIYSVRKNRLQQQISYPSDLIESLIYHYFRHSLSIRQQILKLSVQLTSFSNQNPFFITFIERTAVLSQKINTNTLLLKLTIQLLTNTINDIIFNKELDDFIFDIFESKNQEIIELNIILLQQLSEIRQFKLFSQLSSKINAQNLKLMFQFLAQYIQQYNIDINQFKEIFQDKYQENFELAEFAKVCFLRGENLQIDQDWLIYQLEIPFRGVQDVQNLLNYSFTVEFEKQNIILLYDKFYLCQDLFLELFEFITDDLILDVEYETVFDWTIYCLRNQQSGLSRLRNIIGKLHNSEQVIGILNQEDRLTLEEIQELQLED